jgi:hypothetical protein
MLIQEIEVIITLMQVDMQIAAKETVIPTEHTIMEMVRMVR